MKKQWSMIKFVILVLCLAFAVTGCGQKATQQASEDKKEEKLKVGFIYLSTPGDGGWTYAHDQARKYLEEQLPYVETSFVENVHEGGGDAERYMEQMINNGVKVIFATSFGYMDAVINVAKKHPDVYLLHCTGFKRENNSSTYDIKECDATYLTGIVAGKMTKNNTIGYVAAQPIPSVIRAIDSFALGVKAVNPNAKIKLVWTSTWYDPAKEKEAALGLLDVGCDVLAQYQDTPAVQQAAQERGAYAIGFHSDMRQFAPKANLTSFMWNWGPLYVEQVKAYHDGTWKSIDAWPGMKEGACDIAPLNEQIVPADVKKLVEDTKSKLLNGEVQVFKGPIKDNKGNVMAEEGKVIPDEELRGINWLADNVVGAIPGAK